MSALNATSKRAGQARSAAAGRKGACPSPERQLGTLVRATLEDGKAEDVIAIDMSGKSALADEMIIASGRSARHVAAITEQLSETLKAAGFGPLRIEGVPHCDWVLVDAGDVIVHIFRPEVRAFYNLEKLWSPHAPSETTQH